MKLIGTLSLMAVTAAAFAINPNLAGPMAMDQYNKMSNDQKKVYRAYEGWKTAFNTRNSAKVVNTYASNAVLNATFGQTPITTQRARLDYFNGLLANDRISVKADEIHARMVGKGTGVASGLQTFTFFDKEGKKVTVQTRFSYVFEKRGNDWMIVDHHNSVVPAK